jgi:hypothetical protein
MLLLKLGKSLSVLICLARMLMFFVQPKNIKVPIPCKLLGLHEAFEKNFDWICPENPFDESSEPKSVHKGSSKTHLDTIQFIVEKTSAIDLNASFDIT